MINWIEFISYPVVMHGESGRDGLEGMEVEIRGERQEKRGK
jgi:hypothetical protein